MGSHNGDAMDPRTRRYLAGRFRDHYRRTSVSPPPQAHRREWGYIPWDSRSGTTMVRHRSLADLGKINDFLEQAQPQHVYYSAGQYRDPAAATMAEKDWKGADLVFDLDADHLPGVAPDDPYHEMLSRCKAELFDLLDMLQADFGFTDLDIIFSGNRGYHVHVRSESVRPLPREARREIAEYIHGESVALESLVERDLVAGVGRETPAQVRRLDTERGWGARIHRELLDRVDHLRSLSTDEAHDVLEDIDGIGQRRAGAIVEAIDRSYDEIADGNLDVHPAFLTFVKTVVEDATINQGAAIDEPVTTDVNRLIRLPGSLHGGSGLVARRITPETLDIFDPLSHAIPETFRDHEITVDVPAETSLELGGRTWSIESGTARVPEYVGVHLMVTERATKGTESIR